MVSGETLTTDSGAGASGFSGPLPRSAQRLVAALPTRYSFRCEIGEGGAAYVFLADDLERHQTVAVKVLRPEVATAVGEKRFQREIEIVRRFDHPNILPLLDYGSVNGQVYFTMPFVEGDTLETRIKRDRQLPMGAVLSIVSDVAAALDHAHACGIIHRDIKPSNILLMETGAVVCDFGIARAIAVERSEAITASGVSLGTPQYMSPEQGAGIRELDARCDVYALGCVVYEMLTGQPPFTGRTEQVIIARHCSEPARSARVVRPDIPIEADKAILRALAKVRAHRFHSAGEFFDAFDAGAGS